MSRGRPRKNTNNTTTNTINTTNTTKNTANTSKEDKNLTYVDPKKEIRETVISCVSGDNYCTIYSNEVWGRNLCNKMLKEHPEDVKLIREYPEDGTIEIKAPLQCIKYVRYPTKREMTDEQKEAAGERMKKAREVRKAMKEENS